MENPSLELLMRQSFPDLAAAIRVRSPRILERFRKMVKEILPSGDELTLNQLLDHIPQVLEDLAVAIALPDGGSKRGNFLADSGQHGVCRYHQSFNLSELLLEYSILRTILLEEVGKALQRSLSNEELSGLNAGIDASSRRAVESFVAYQKREIQTAVEAQSKYLSFLSHDLRGNLNGILLMLEVLRRELGGLAQFENSMQDLDMMRRSILDTVGTMDRLLHAERFRRGKVEVRLTEVNLSTLIPDVVNQMSSQAKSKGVDIWVDTSRCPTVIGDRELVTLILQNLIGNAIKYSQKGEIRISATLTAEGNCRIGVADSGPGITDEKLKDLFRPFSRGETHGQGGMGLGLFIARQSADLMEAKLWANSKPGAGSIFYLELPLRKPN